MCEYEIRLYSVPWKSLSFAAEDVYFYIVPLNCPVLN